MTSSLSFVEQKQLPSYLIVFDFDHTVIDQNSDVTVMAALGMAEKQEELMKDRMQWTNMCSRLLESFTKQDIQEAIHESIVVDPVMVKVFELLTVAKEMSAIGNDGDEPRFGGVEVAVASDANTLFISETFDALFPASTHGVVDSIHSNPIHFFDNDGSKKNCEVRWYAENGHECKPCNDMHRYNMCKSCIVRDLLRKTKLIDPTIIFIGDGSNDHCPVLRVLRQRDFVFSRRDMALASRLQKAGGAGLCQKWWWSNPSELLTNFEMVLFGGSGNKNITISARPTLPPRFLFHDGGADEFRAKTLATRMPALIDRTIESNVKRWRHEEEELKVHPVGTAALRSNLLNALASSAKNNTTLDEFVVAVNDVAAAASAPQVGDAVRDIIKNSHWLSAFASTETACSARWGELPWLEGEVAFNLIVITLCHATLDEKKEKAENATASLLHISPTIASSFPLNLITTGLENGKEEAGCLKQHDSFSSAAQFVDDVYAVEKAASVNAFIESHIIPMVSVAPETTTTATSTNPLDWRCSESLPAILHQSLWGNAVDLSMFHLKQLKADHHSDSSSSPATSPVAATTTTTFDDDKMIVANYISDIAKAVRAAIAAKNPTTTTEQEHQQSVTYVDIIQDNVGVENAADLLLALWLIEEHKKMVTIANTTKEKQSNILRVRLHVKPMPHYVSDTMPHDIDILLSTVEKSFTAAACGDASSNSGDGGRAFVAAMRDALAAGKQQQERGAEDLLRSGIELHTDPFWISPGEYRTMPPALTQKYFFKQQIALGGRQAKNIHHHQQPSQPTSVPRRNDPLFKTVPLTSFVLVKGDLNFRRLVGDRHWEKAITDGSTSTTVALKDAIKDYWPFDVVPIAALRTLKSEVNVGPTAEKIAELDATEVKDSWRVSGKHAVALIAANNDGNKKEQTVTSRHVSLVSIVVDDYDKAIEFYTRAMQFELLEDIDQGSKRWVVVAPPLPPNAPSNAKRTSLVLAKAKNAEETSRIGNQLGGPVGFFLETSCFAKDHQHMKQEGVEFLEEPRYEEYGTVAVFKDLFGNKWDLIERPKVSSAVGQEEVSAAAEGETFRRIAHFTFMMERYDDAISFYTKALQLNLLQDIDLTTFRWVVVSTQKAEDKPDAASIVIAQPNTEEEKSRIGNQLGGRVGFFLETTNFVEDYCHMRKCGVKFLEAPRYEPYGIVAVFEDLYGNKWDLLERK